jgi:hypothetical protein
VAVSKLRGYGDALVLREKPLLRHIRLAPDLDP